MPVASRIIMEATVACYDSSELTSLGWGQQLLFYKVPANLIEGQASACTSFDSGTNVMKIDRLLINGLGYCSKGGLGFIHNKDTINGIATDV